LLDDERFVENFVSYRAARGQGPVRIGRELRGLGLGSELIGRFLDEREWLEPARRLRRRKFGAALPDTAAGKAKQARFLQYRGFTAAQVRLVLGTDIDIEDAGPDLDAPVDDD
jgi:regulatory protein